LALNGKVITKQA